MRGLLVALAATLLLAGGKAHFCWVCSDALHGEWAVTRRVGYGRRHTGTAAPPPDPLPPVPASPRQAPTSPWPVVECPCWLPPPFTQPPMPG